MRFTKTFSLALSFALLATAVQAQGQPPGGVDEIAGKISAIDKQTAELAKQRSGLVGDLRTELKRIADVVEKLGLDAPQPPVPPKPPVPTDPLVAKLKAAYDADPAALDARKGLALNLAAMYRATADLASDPEVTTASALIEQMTKAIPKFLSDPPGGKHLAGVRRVVGSELGAVFPTESLLTDDQRKAATALFLKFAVALEECAK